MLAVNVTVPVYTEPSGIGCKICAMCVGPPRTIGCPEVIVPCCTILLVPLLFAEAWGPVVVAVVFRKLEVLLFLLLLLLPSCASALWLKGSDKVETDNTAKVTVKTATAIAAVAPTFFCSSNIG